jgi:hypothetical protein
MKISKATQKTVHNIDSDGYRLPENWEKDFGTPPQEGHQRTAPKIAPSFWSQKRKWRKIPHNLHINPHPEKSITPCSGLPTTSNIPHPTICIFHHKPIITTKPILQHTTNHTTMPHPTILNLRQLHR